VRIRRTGGGRAAVGQPLAGWALGVSVNAVQ